MRKRLNLSIKGTVQGVGFRPFVYNLARRHSLAGYVRNSPSGVCVEVEGEEESLRRFVAALKKEAPAVSFINRIQRRRVPLKGERDFAIVRSAQGEAKSVFISPDLSICDECLKEMFDEHNRRFHYPFINCTNCGPRYSIIEDVPYDRCSTTMKEFKMCPACREEYEDVRNRRFHAQPNACFRCGPSVALVQKELRRIKRADRHRSDVVFEEAAYLIQQGKILAVKGLGGYHICCDAYNTETVARLRRSKRRPAKPFALMAGRLDTVKEYCHVNAREEEILTGVRRPIVLLRIRKKTEWMEEVAPCQHFLGIMLAYTPLHYLLFYYLGRLMKNPLLVMTSANLKGEPIIHRDRDIFALKGRADAFIVHNRRIHVPVEDSVVRIYNNRLYMLRKGRGYTPDFFKFESPRRILACGAEIKSTFAIAEGRWMVTSPYLGELNNRKTYRHFLNTLEHFQKIFGFRPEVVAYDRHPQYIATRYALSLPGVHRVAVQHHHAHAVSCMVENNLEGDVVAVVFDGVGFGDDGAVWGGEFLVCNRNRFHRRGHFAYFPLVGKDKAVEEPYRTAATLLYEVFGEGLFGLKIRFVEDIGKKRIGLLVKLVKAKYYVGSSSVGRLFDAVASILRLKDKISYEAEAAIMLEMLAHNAGGAREPYTLVVKRRKGRYIVDWRSMVREIVEDLLRHREPSYVALRFHLSLAEATVRVCSLLRKDYGYGRVVLSGGVFQNELLLNMIVRSLRRKGFGVYTHSRFPPNDECISVGQVAIANAKLKKIRR